MFEIEPILSSTEGETGTETVSKTVTKKLKPWKVLVHDDPISPMTYVTKVLMKQFGYPQTKAERLMLEVHNQGQAVVWTGAREQAELHVQKLHGQHLRASLQQET